MKAIFSIIIIFFVIFIVLINFFYVMTAIVIDINYDSDIVTIESASGDQWEFWGCNNWQIGDLIECIMFDNNTKMIYDDIIIYPCYISITF